MENYIWKYFIVFPLSNRSKTNKDKEEAGFVLSHSLGVLWDPI